MYTGSVICVVAGTSTLNVTTTRFPACTRHVAFRGLSNSGFGAGVDKDTAKRRTADKSPCAGSFAFETSIFVTVPAASNVTRAYWRTCGAAAGAFVHGRAAAVAGHTGLVAGDLVDALRGVPELDG